MSQLTGILRKVFLEVVVDKLIFILLLLLDISFLKFAIRKRPEKVLFLFLFFF